MFKKIMKAVVVLGRPRTGLGHVLKANPYHDEKGRFATRDKHSFMSSGPAFQKVIARAKEGLKAAEKTHAAREYVLVNQELSKLNEYDVQMTEATQIDWEKLSTEEISAVYDYTGFMSGDMNMYASGNKEKIAPNALTVVGGTEVKLVDHVKSLCSKMDVAANKCSLPADTMLYRAMNINRLGSVGHLGKFGSGSTKDELEALIGESFLDTGYGSTSTALRTARFFRDSNRPIFVIKAPAGTKGLWVGSDHLPTDGPDRTKVNRSGTGTEHEFIMQRNRAYKVVGVEEHSFPARETLPGEPTAPITKMNVVVVEMLNHDMPVEVGNWGI